jgi:hypothetical protein
MGVDTRFITMYGVKLPYDRDFEEMIDERETVDTLSELGYLSDGMAGEYLMLGKVYLKTDSMRWEAPSGFVEIPIDELAQDKAHYLYTFGNMFPDYVNKLEALEWKLYSFVHYS